MNNRLNASLWELYNKYSINGIMIISRADFKRETERISIQNNADHAEESKWKDY